MFDKAKGEGSESRRIAAVNAEMAPFVENPSALRLTPILMEPEPYKSFALEYIDGLERHNTIISRTRDPVELPPIRLVCIDESPSKTGQIRYKVWKRVRVPGTTDKYEEGWHWVGAGNDATLPHKQARFSLRTQGWPIVNAASNGGRTGTVVEWAWLCDEVTKPDASDEVKELHARLSARVGKQQQTKTRGQQTAGVSP